MDHGHTKCHDPFDPSIRGAFRQLARRRTKQIATHCHTTAVR